MSRWFAAHRLVWRVNIQMTEGRRFAPLTTEAANEAWRLIFMIRRSFQDFLKTAFILLYGALVRPHLEYGMPVCSLNLVAEISCKVGNWHASPPLWRKTAATTTSGWLGYRLQIFTGLLDIDPNLFCLPPTRRGLRGRPYKVLSGASHRRRRVSAFLVKVVKYWNKLPTSVVRAPSVNVVKKRLEKVWTAFYYG